MATYAVLGAGNGGQCIYAYLKLKGCAVTLYDRYPKVLEPIQERGGIQLTGVSLNGFADAAGVCEDMGQAVQDAKVIFVVLPAFAHAYIAEQLAPLLRSGQILILCPGSTGGVLEVRKILRDCGCTADIKLAETNSLFYACRVDANGNAVIGSVKSVMPIAAMPSSDTDGIIELLQDTYPQLVREQNVLASDLGNLNSVIHPIPVLLNTGWIEATGGDFRYYYDSITPTVGKLVERVDAERLAVAKALGLNVKTLIESMELYYGATGETICEAVRKVEGYAIVRAPASMQTRLVLEDIPMGAVPITELGRLAGVATPALDLVIDLASQIMDRNFRVEGRTLERLGINGLTKEALLEYVK